MDHKNLFNGTTDCRTISYKRTDIIYNFYGRKEYTVFFEGDDVWFNTLDAAKAFIDKMEV